MRLTAATLDLGFELLNLTLELLFKLRLARALLNIQSFNLLVGKLKLGMQLLSFAVEVTGS